MRNCLAVGLGGCLGSVLRYLLSLVPLDRTGSFPVNTLLTNVLGAFAIGLLAAALSRQSGRYLPAALYILLSLGLSLAAVFLAESF